MKYHNGIIDLSRLKNPDKYRGKLPIVYRSTWERQFLFWLDSTKEVEYWGSESTIIPYYNPVKGRKARYFMDFTAKINGVVYLIEIKPHYKTQKPNPKKYKQILEWQENQAKWTAAENYCSSKGYKFKIITEKDLF